MGERVTRLVRSALLAVLPLLAACAQMDPPPGGPEDRTPPYPVAKRPDSMAVIPGFNGAVVIEFSERISEQGVEEAVMVSPRTSPVAVDRGSRSIRVFLRRGWEPGQIYQVTLRPGIQDLFNNRITQPIQMVFSTGPEIPDTRLAGSVIDRITGEPEADARVEAIRRTDSLVYAVPTDSAGRFVFAHVPEGEYLLRAFPDANRNRNLDVFEARDSLLAAITTADTAAVELSLVMPDSTPPAIASISAGAEGRISVRFDDYLDPAQVVEPSAVTVTGADGVALVVAAVTVGDPPPDSAPGVPADTAPAAVADTAVVETVTADTMAADTQAVAGQPAAPAAAADSVGPVRRLPAQLLTVQLGPGVVLTPEAEYTVAVSGIRNVVGLTGDSEATFTAPEPPPAPPAEPADTDPPPDNPPEP